MEQIRYYKELSDELVQNRNGLIISILSLLSQVTEPLHVYILTAALDLETARCN